jgi:hypothetical protein
MKSKTLSPPSPRTALATEAPPRQPETRVSRLKLAASEDPFSLVLVLSGGFLLAIALRYLLAREIVTPWIMADELIYSEMAKNFADSGEFLLRERTSPLRNRAYPALIAPAWLAEPMETVYGLARFINVVVMSLVAVVVYLWGRRMMSTGWALLAAALVLLMPSFVYTGMLMTENAFIPTFVAGCFAIALALERPTLFRQALPLAAIALTFFVRPQGLVLLAIYVIALALKLAFDLREPGQGRGFRYLLRELRRFLPTGLTLLFFGVVYVGVKAIQGIPVKTGLGSYSGVVEVEYDRAIATQWIVDHFAEIGLSLALIPVSALIVLFGLSFRGWVSTSAERAFVAVAVSAFVLVVVQVGLYASRFALRIEERNMVCVAPLLLLALCLWLARGLPRPWLLAAVAGLVPAMLLFALDLKALLNIGILSDTFGLIPLLRLSGLLEGGVESIETLMGLAGIAAALAFVLLPRRVAVVALPAGVALALAASSYSVFGSIRNHSERTLALTSTTNPSWIDEQIGSRSSAVYVFGATPDYFGEAQILWQTEFWNRSLGTVYTLGPPDPGLTASPASFDGVTGRITPQFGTRDSAERIRYVVAPRAVKLHGRLLAEQEWLALYQVEPPMRLATALGGVYPDRWMADFAAFTHYATPKRAGSLQVRISREGWGGPSPPGRVTINVGLLGDLNGTPAISYVLGSRTWTVRSGTAREFTLPTPKAPYRLEVRVTPTFSPLDYGQPDSRQLGAQVQISSASSWTG